MYQLEKVQQKNLLKLNKRLLFNQMVTKELREREIERKGGKKQEKRDAEILRIKERKS